MLVLKSLTTLTLFAVAYARAAPRSKDSPDGVSFNANFDDPIYGGVSFTGVGGFVRVHVDIEGLPERRGLYSYHINENPVPDDGECYATGGVFDPYNGDPHAKIWALAQVGDLSGKHGFLRGGNDEKDYFDPYLSLNPENLAFVGDLSVVVRSRRSGEIVACSNLYETSLTHPQNSRLNQTAPQNLPQAPGSNTTEISQGV